MSVKITYNQNKKIIYKDGQKHPNIPLEWNGLSVDAEKRENFGRKPSVLVGSRVGVTEDQDNPFDIFMNINGDTFVTRNSGDIVLTVNVIDDSEEVVADENIKIAWFVNGQKKSNRHVFKVNKSDFTDRNNNVVTAQCEVNGIDLKVSESFLRYDNYDDGTSQPVDDSEFGVEVLPDVIRYDVKGNPLVNEIKVQVNGFATYDSIDYFLNGNLFARNTLSTKISRSQFPRDGQSKTLRVVIVRDGITEEFEKIIHTDTTKFNPKQDGKVNINMLSSGVIRLGDTVSFEADVTDELTKFETGYYADKRLERVIWDFGEGQTYETQTPRTTYEFEETGAHVVNVKMEFEKIDGFIIKVPPNIIEGSIILEVYD